MRILVVEAGRKVANELAQGLKGERYETVVEPTGKDALLRMSTERFSLVLLDLPLPDCDMFDILQATRRRSLEMRVLVLSHRAAVADRISGLNAGADDYLVKPVAFAELTARIRILLRGRREESGCIRTGGLSLDLVARYAKRDGVVVKLSSREFELLRYLLQHKGQLVTRDALGCDVWEKADCPPSLYNLIDVHVAGLRRKIDLGRPKKLIHTVRGLGFVLREEE